MLCLFAMQADTHTASPRQLGQSTSPQPGPAPADAIFADNFEAHQAGCGMDQLLGGLWEDFGPAVGPTCAANLAAIVTDQAYDGTKSLRVTQYPGKQNGTDFRIVKTIGDRSDVWVRYAVRYAPDFRFATADHKTLIFMDQAQAAQNIYINIRGTAGDPSRGRITVHSIPVDTAMSDASRARGISVGGWHVIDAWVHAGVNGFVRVRLDGVPLKLSTEAGNRANPEKLNTGSIGAIKLDTTYNIGSFVTAPMNQYFDAVQVFAHGW